MSSERLFSDEKDGEKENGRDNGHENSKWRWWCDGGYLIVMTIIARILENLRNQFLCIMVELGNFAERYNSATDFQFPFKQKFLIKLNPKFYLIEISFTLFFWWIMYTCRKGLGVKIWIGLRSVTALGLQKFKLKDSER